MIRIKKTIDFNQVGDQRTLKMTYSQLYCKKCHDVTKVHLRLNQISGGRNQNLTQN